MRNDRSRQVAWLLAASSVLACTLAHANGALQPPPGYLGPVRTRPGHSEPCETVPAPFTATLDFPSKYSGSGSSRDELNPEAEAQYKDLAQPITSMEAGFSKIVGRYMEAGDPAQLACAIHWIDSWATARALTGEAANHTGKSLRKWALGSLSGAWLRLKFSSSKPLDAYPQEAARIEAWLGAVAIRVALEWSPNDRIDKINNHYYWAAWALMATAVVTNRRELFDDALATYRVFAKQVDADGFLPNELKRASRAANYHNYAMLPLSMLGAFAKANGVPAEPGLSRLAVRAEAALTNPASFEARAGAKQEVAATSKASWAWLEPYCWTVPCSAALLSRRESLRPLATTRLGGNLSAVFSASGALPKPPVIEVPVAREVTSGLDALNQLCRSTLDKGDYDEAQRVCKRISFDVQTMAPGTSAHLSSLLNMAEIKVHLANYLDADGYYSSALELIEGGAGPDSEQALGIVSALIELRVKRGKYLDAAALAKRVLSSREKALGPDTAQVAIARARYADLLSQSHQFPEAEAMYGRAISVLEHSGALHAETFALTVQHLGEMYERRSQYIQAERQYRRVVTIVERNALSYRLLAGAFDRVGYVCEQQDKATEAAAFYRRAISTLRGTPTPPEVMERIQGRLAALGPQPASASARPAVPGGATDGSQGTQ